MTDDHRHILQHSLGLTRSEKPYRNHFAASTGSPDFLSCQSLVEAGYMQLGGDLGYGRLFHVTADGAKAVGSTLPGD